MPDRPNSSASVAVVLGRLAVLDGMLLTGSFMIWAFIGGIDMVVHALAMVARVAALHMHAWRMLEPVRSWQEAGGKATDNQLVAADAALQHFPRRLMISYTTGWALLHAFDALVMLAAPRGDVLAASAELVTFTLLSFAAVTVSIALMTAGAPFMASELTAEVSRQCYEAKLDSHRPPSSYTRELQRFVAVMSFAVVIGIFAAGIKIRVDGIREHTLATEKIHAILAAADARRGEPVPESMQLVSERELPAVLLEARAAGDPSTSQDMASLIGAIDYEREQVVAAAHVEGPMWVISAATPDEQLFFSTLFTFVLALLVGAIGAVAATGLAMTIGGPLRELRAASRRMADEGDLRAIGHVIPQRRDELGALVADFNAMLDMFAELGDAATAVAEGDLRVSLDHPGEVHGAFRNMVAQLRALIMQLRSTSLEVASGSAEIEASTQAREQAAIHHSEIVREASATVASLTDAAQTIDTMAHAVHEDAAQSLATTDEMITKIAELDRLTSGIGDLLEQIREIADRSDLLALNGSLEATRAGEAGRGFSLVAGEMRRLAERVTGIVSDVRKHIGEIEVAGSETVAATDRGRALTQRTVEAARQISTVTHKQSQDTGRAAEATQSMAEFVISSASEASQTRAAAEGLREQVTELDRLTQYFDLGGAEHE